MKNFYMMINCFSKVFCFFFLYVIRNDAVFIPGRFRSNSANNNLSLTARTTFFQNWK